MAFHDDPMLHLGNFGDHGPRKCPTCDGTGRIAPVGPPDGEIAPRCPGDPNGVHSFVTDTAGLRCQNFPCGWRPTTIWSYPTSAGRPPLTFDHRLYLSSAMAY